MTTQDTRTGLLDEPAARRLVGDWQGPLDGALPRSAPPVADLVAEHAASRPDAPAVIDATTTLSYRQLVAAGDRIAADLHRRGVGGEDVVAVRLPRGALLVAAELGVLRAGAAFLPVDPDTPAERCAQVLTSSGAVLLIGDGQPLAGAGSVPRLVLDATTVGGAGVSGRPADPSSARPRPGPDSLAYVIYTSGSTGRPKGVLIGQHALANLAAWHARTSGLGPGVRTTVVASPGFDFSVWEIWPALAAGATLCIPSAEILLSPPDLRRWLDHQAVEVLLLPTPMAESLLDLPDLGTQTLRVVHAAGDRLTRRPPAGARYTLFNSYGPTENTAISTSGPVPAESAGQQLPSIGTPVAGTAAYLLDERMRPVPTGTVGELYLAGAGLARGYHRQPGLTAVRFVADPWSPRPGARLYRTGDLARYRPDGSIDFLGRVDDQVKIRGFRVEPAEVTAALRQHPAVRDAYTLADRTGPAVRLVAYLVAAGAVPDRAELHTYLGRTLPAYMLPAEYVPLDALPLTVNGKVDRRALPAPAPAPEPAAEPRTELEERLAAIWAAVLGRPAVGPDDDFFALGGHSLTLNQVRARISRELGRKVPLAALFEYLTVRELAAYLSATDT